MSNQVWDAYFSKKMINTCGYYNIYSDVNGNNFACCGVVKTGDAPGMLWDDLVYLGQVINHVRRVSGNIIILGVLTSPLKVTAKLSTSTKAIKAGEAVNDYVCPACNNDKCSKTEKSCWKCGFRFSNG